MIARLEPVVLEMERLQEPLLIVGHQVRTAHEGMNAVYLWIIRWGVDPSDPLACAYSLTPPTPPPPKTHHTKTNDQGILRIIYAFYMGLTRAQAPYVSIPLNCIVKLEPSAFHCQEEVRFGFFVSACVVVWAMSSIRSCPHLPTPSHNPQTNSTHLPHKHTAARAVLPRDGPPQGRAGRAQRRARRRARGGGVGGGEILSGGGPGITLRH